MWSLCEVGPAEALGEVAWGQGQASKGYPRESRSAKVVPGVACADGHGIPKCVLCGRVGAPSQDPKGIDLGVAVVRTFQKLPDEIEGFSARSWRGPGGRGRLQAQSQAAY